MMLLKPGVRIAGVRPEVVLAITIAHSVYARFNQRFCVVTEIMPTVKHMDKSKHAVGQAFDLRLPHALAVTEIVDDLRMALSTDFDVVLEKDHIHVEFDPKN